MNSIDTICGVPSRLVCGVGNRGPELTQPIKINAAATAGAAKDIELMVHLESLLQKHLWGEKDIKDEEKR